jgi:hypothetical protein
MVKLVALILTVFFAQCKLFLPGETCTDCMSPALKLSFFDAATAEKIVLPRMTIVYNAKDTMRIASDSLGSGGDFRSADSSLWVYHGTGVYTIIIDAPKYEKATIDPIRVTDDGTVCKRIYTQVLEIQLTPRALSKRSANSFTIKSRKTELGC